MTNLDDIETIRDRFFSTFDKSVRVALDTDVITDLGEEETYVRFLVHPGDEVARSCGIPRRYEAKGRVYLYIFVPLGLKLRSARQLEASFVQAFREWTADDRELWFELPSFNYSETKTHMILETSIIYRSIH